MPLTPQMTGKLCLVTGATSGIGRETALRLARLGARVVITGRDAGRLQETARYIRAASGDVSVETLQADLLRQSEVRNLAEEFKKGHDRLDVLVNNAGAIFFERRLTPDGYERTWALNHLAYFLLTLLLLDPLRAAESARIVNVASSAHERAALDFDDLQSERHFTPMGAYSRSKLANVLFT
ncbi:MAG: SDR family NAD(P)-dependent oxidoreductase, partial [Acetobacteraceae bacterium]